MQMILQVWLIAMAPKNPMASNWRRKRQESAIRVWVSRKAPVRELRIQNSIDRRSCHDRPAKQEMRTHSMPLQCSARPKVLQPSVPCGGERRCRNCLPVRPSTMPARCLGRRSGRKETTLRRYRTNKMNRVQKFGLVFVMCVVVPAAVADSLELKNGSLVKGRFMGGDQNSINFQVGSSLQTYNVGDIRDLRFDSEPEGAAVSVPSAGQQYA